MTPRSYVNSPTQHHSEGLLVVIRYLLPEDKQDLGLEWCFLRRRETNRHRQRESLTPPPSCQQLVVCSASRRSVTWTSLAPSPCPWPPEEQMGRTARSSPQARETSWHSDRSTSPVVCQPSSLIQYLVCDCIHPSSDGDGLYAQRRERRSTRLLAEGQISCASLGMRARRPLESSRKVTR